MRKFVFLVALAVFGFSAINAFAGPKVKFETSKGDIVVELAGDKVPKTVANFVAYVNAGFFDGTIFHRVIPNFMIQGGGMTVDMERKKTEDPIMNEAYKAPQNLRGTIAMARTANPHSATGQFFINTKDNMFLNHRAKSRGGWGYTVFGRVIEGMDTVEKIEAVRTTTQAGQKDVPVEPVVIIKAQIIE